MASVEVAGGAGAGFRERGEVLRAEADWILAECGG